MNNLTTQFLNNVIIRSFSKCSLNNVGTHLENWSLILEVNRGIALLIMDKYILLIFFSQINLIPHSLKTKLLRRFHNIILVYYLSFNYNKSPFVTLRQVSNYVFNIIIRSLRNYSNHEGVLHMESVVYFLRNNINPFFRFSHSEVITMLATFGPVKYNI